MEKLIKFKELGLSETMLKSLKKKGFEAPSPIQEKIIPLLLDETKNIIGQAQTGTGKTAAFGIPLIEKLTPRKSLPQSIILAPTRELAIQVSEELNSLKNRSKLSVLPVYGGQSISMQIRHLEKGIDIVVGTPGRIIDLINRKKLNLTEISSFILDEADEMLNMGFIEDIEQIMKSTNDHKQILLFSATMPTPIKKIAKKYMGDFVHIKVTDNVLTTDLTEQIYFEVLEQDKFESLCRIIDTEQDFYGIIFCRTKIDADKISSRLNDRGYDAEGLHGDISQSLREKILGKFRRRKINVLAATDVAARGIDISDLSHVINFSLPQDPESYVHRIGRTGRAGKEGTAITFITPSEYRRLMFIQKKVNVDIRKKSLPKVAKVIEIKKERIKNEIESIMETVNLDEYLNFANDIIADQDPKSVIAAFIQHFYEDEFKESSYKEIKELGKNNISRKNSVDKKGKTRLYIHLGRVNKYSPKSLVDYISKQSKIPARFIRDVKVYDKFSFITTSFMDAEVILKVFKNKNKKSKRPFVEIAKDKKQK